jgi:hypothetical protein
MIPKAPSRRPLVLNASVYPLFEVAHRLQVLLSSCLLSVCSTVGTVLSSIPAPGQYINVSSCIPMQLFCPLLPTFSRVLNFFLLSFAICFHAQIASTSRMGAYLDILYNNIFEVIRSATPKFSFLPGRKNTVTLAPGYTATMLLLSAVTVYLLSHRRCGL